MRTYAIDFAQPLGIRTCGLVAGKRRYVLQYADGKRHEFGASVTQISSHKWGDDDFQSLAMEESAAVHAAIEAELMDIPQGYALPTDEAQNCLEAFRDYRLEKLSRATFLGLECPVWHVGLNVAGTFDCLVRLADGRWKLIDWKGLTPPFKMLSAHRVQLAGYASCLEHIGHPPIDEASVLMLAKDGSGWQEIVAWDTPEARMRWQFAFASACTVRIAMTEAKRYPVRVVKPSVVQDWDSPPGLAPDPDFAAIIAEGEEAMASA